MNKYLRIIILVIIITGINAFCHTEKNKTNQDIKEYDKRIKDNPNDAFLYDVRATLYFEIDNYDNAIKDHLHAINLSKDDSFYYFLSKTYLAKGDIEKAFDAIQNSMKINKHRNYYFIRALCFDFKNNPKEALKDYETFLIDKTPQAQDFNYYYIACIRRGIILYNNGIYDKAFIEFENGIYIGKMIKKSSQDIYYLRFLANMKLKKYPDVYNDLDVVLNEGFNNKERLLNDIKNENDDFKSEVSTMINKKMKFNTSMKDIVFYNQDYLIKKLLGKI